jgi:hypothetical protein
VALKFKLLSTEIQAAKQERTVNKGIQRELELLYNIFRITDSGIGDYTDVKIEFERNFIMLADDRLQEMNLDLQRFNAGLISQRQFLVKYDNLTPKEADEAIEIMDKENPFRAGEFELNKSLLEEMNNNGK